MKLIALLVLVLALMASLVQAQYESVEGYQCESPSCARQCDHHRKGYCQKEAHCTC